MVVITEGKRHDVRVARTVRFDAGTVVVMDRGYVDDAWFGLWHRLLGGQRLIMGDLGYPY